MRQTVVSGNEKKTFDTVSENLSVNGDATVTIKGNIRSHCTIALSGSARLIVQGIVDEGAIFIIKDNALVIFINRPPESILQRLIFNFPATVVVPGGLFFSNTNHNNDDNNNNHTNSSPRNDLKIASNAVQTVNTDREKVLVSVDDGLITVTRNGMTNIYQGKKSSVIGDTVYIDGTEVTRRDPRLISSSAETSQFPAAKAALTTFARLAQQFHPLTSLTTTTTTTTTSSTIQSTENEYTTYFNDYLKGFENNSTLAEKINTLGKLAPEEEALFEKFCDCISEEYMQIPVQLHEQWFDFQTLKGKTMDPNHNVPFHPYELQTGRELIKEAEALIKQVENKRAQACLSNNNNEMPKEKSIFSVRP